MSVSREVLTFIIIGVSWNALFYGGFVLLVNGFDAPPKATMTVLYVIGVVLSFYLNRRMTFRSEGALGKEFIKFSLLYLVGYGINYVGLVLLIDQMHVAAWISQGLMAVLLAVFFFVSQKLLVFKTPQFPQ